MPPAEFAFRVFSSACVKILTSPMFSSNTIKFLFVLAVSGGCSCGYWRGETNATPAAPTPFVAAELKSDVPFATKEPDEYQTEIVITGADGVEEKIFAAKSGANSLLVFDFQTKNEISMLRVGESQKLIVARHQKICAENKNEAAAPRDSASDFLTAELINQSLGARFEPLGAADDLVKYRANFDDAKNSEIVIYVDEKIGLPVKQEFYGIAGEQKILTLTMELKNFKRRADAGIFEPPKDCRKVSPKEFRETLRRERIK